MQLYRLIGKLLAVYFFNISEVATRVALLFHYHGKTIPRIQAPISALENVQFSWIITIGTVLTSTEQYQYLYGNQ